MIFLKDLILLIENEVHQRRSRNIDDTVDVVKMLTTTHKLGWDYYIQSGNALYRSLYGADRAHLSDYVFTDPKLVRRYTRDALSNLYVALLDSLESWRGFPRRGHSIIFGSSLKVAENYGGWRYICFFDNNFTAAMADKSDIFYGFKNIQLRLPEVRDVDNLGLFWIKTLPTIYSICFESEIPIKKDKRAYTEENIDEFFSVINEHLTKENINKMQDCVKSEKLLDSTARYTLQRASEVFEDIDKYNGYGDYKKYFDELLDPKKNDVKLVKSFAEVDYSSNSEMWTESSAILVHVDLVEKLRSEMLKNKASI